MPVHPHIPSSITYITTTTITALSDKAARCITRNQHNVMHCYGTAAARCKAQYRTEPRNTANKPRLSQSSTVSFSSPSGSTVPQTSYFRPEKQTSDCPQGHEMLFGGAQFIRSERKNDESSVLANDSETALRPSPHLPRPRLPPPFVYHFMWLPALRAANKSFPSRNVTPVWSLGSVRNYARAVAASHSSFRRSRGWHLKTAFLSLWFRWQHVPEHDRRTKRGTEEEKTSVVMRRRHVPRDLQRRLNVHRARTDGDRGRVRYRTLTGRAAIQI